MRFLRRRQRAHRRHDRPGLERLLRSCARPAFALERLREIDAEHLVYERASSRVPAGPDRGPSGQQLGATLASCVRALRLVQAQWRAQGHDLPGGHAAQASRRPAHPASCTTAAPRQPEYLPRTPPIHSPCSLSRCINCRCSLCTRSSVRRTRVCGTNTSPVTTISATRPWRAVSADSSSSPARPPRRLAQLRRQRLETRRARAVHRLARSPATKEPATRGEQCPLSDPAPDPVQGPGRQDPLAHAAATTHRLAGATVTAPCCSKPSSRRPAIAAPATRPPTGSTSVKPPGEARSAPPASRSSRSRISGSIPFTDPPDHSSAANPLANPTASLRDGRILTKFEIDAP